MSFILDALKKLEREKETPEAGVVMVGPVPWGGPDRSRGRRARVLGAAGVIVLAGAGIWWLVSRPAPPSSEPSSAPTPEAPARSALSSSPPPAERSLAPPPPRSLDLPAVGKEEEAVPIVAPEVVPVEPEEPAPEQDHVASNAEDEVAPAAEPAVSRDPLPEPPRYRLTAISERDGKPIALLNDRLVREGDRFDGIHVIRIGATEIEIEVDGERLTVGF